MVNQEDLKFRPVQTFGENPSLLCVSSDAVVHQCKDLARLLVSDDFNLRQIVEAYFLCTATVVIIDESVLNMLPIVVGTDGLADVPDPSIFLEDRMFSNQANVTRTLRKMNQPTVRIGGDPPRLVKTDGVLPDDTTLVAIRRKPCA
jgi:hypothetical protein